MWYETDSLDSPLVIIEGPSDPITGPASPVVLEAIERYRRLLAERAEQPSASESTQVFDGSASSNSTLPSAPGSESRTPPPTDAGRP